MGSWGKSEPMPSAMGPLLAVVSISDELPCHLVARKEQLTMATRASGRRKATGIFTLPKVGIFYSFSFKTLLSFT